MPTRFVILHHQTQAGEHWDLMLEHGEVLLTWRLDQEPSHDAPFPIHARRLFDHRKAFLDYEGPLRGDRGYVHRIDSGAVEFQNVTGSEYALRLHGGCLSGSFRLVPRRGDDWSLDLAE